MTQQPGTLSSSLEIGDAAEQQYTKKFLEDVADISFEWEEDMMSISDYAKFYLDNPGAGYAFHKLKRIFEKIDLFIGIKPSKVSASPWDYFDDVESLATFSTKITHLTETLQNSPEPPVVEKIRIVDRSTARKHMFKRIIDLEPSKMTFESDILEHLKDRHSILNAFLKAVYIERARKKASKLSSEGLRQRKIPKTNSSEPSRNQERSSIVGKSSPHWLKRLFGRMEKTLQGPVRANIVKFVSCKFTVLVLSILSISFALVFSGQALYVSINEKAERNFSIASLFNLLGQNVLLGFSLYILIVPFMRGVKLNNERIWFVVCFTIGGFAGISSLIAFRWAPPVSTFLGCVANAAQVLATLLLLQDETKGLSVQRVPPGEELDVRTGIELHALGRGNSNI